MAKVSGTAEAIWAKRVARLRRSGLSIREFATQEGLKAGSLSHWKWRLARRTGQRAEAPRIEPLKFVELTAALPATSKRAPSFKVLLRSGRAVRIPMGFDAAELARLVDVLEEARS
jgi:hypothetical protein